MSIVETLLEKAKQLSSDRKSIARNKYADLVRQLAGGEALDPERVLKILPAAGKSEVDLKHDVEALGTPAELESLKTEEQEFRDRKRELIDEVADLKQQYESIRIQLETSGGELSVVLSRLTRIHNRRLELLRNFPETVPEYGNLKSQFRLYAQQVNALTEKIPKIYARISGPRQHLNEAGSSYRMDGGSDPLIEEWKNEIEAGEEEIRALKKQIDELTKKRNAAKTAMRSFKG